jgi:hypothetical protein
MPTEPEVIERLGEYFAWLERQMGDVAGVPGAAPSLERTHVELAERTRSARPSPRGTLVLVAAAVVALVIGALVLTPRWQEPEAPAGSIPVPTTSLVRAAGDQWAARPLLFPAVPGDDPRFQNASGNYAGRSGLESVSIASALISRVDAGVMVDAVWLRVFAEPPVATFAGSRSEPVTIDGLEFERITDTGFRLDHVPIITLLRRGTPTIAVSGFDPAALVEAVGLPVIDASVSTDGRAGFVLGRLPAGYEVIVEPAAGPLGSWTPQLLVGDATGEQPSVEVTLDSQLPFAAMADQQHAVDVNGVRGWINSRDAYSLQWPLDDGSWASAVAFTENDTIDLARSVEFIDESTWQARYVTEDVHFFDLGSRGGVLAPTTLPSAPSDPPTGT